MLAFMRQSHINPSLLPDRVQQIDYCFHINQGSVDISTPQYYFHLSVSHVLSAFIITPAAFYTIHVITTNLFLSESYFPFIFCTGMTYQLE